MKIKRSMVERITREELVRHLGGFLGEGPKGPDVTDAQDDNEKKEKDKGAQKPIPTPAPKTTERPKPEKKDDKGGKPPDQPVDDDPADKELDKPAGEEDASEVTGGKISKEIVGKTVQSITMEPKSKIMPGAQEIIVQFDQIPDPLRILIGKTGNVKFYFKGLHNEV